MAGGAWTRHRRTWWFLAGLLKAVLRRESLTYEGRRGLLRLPPFWQRSSTSLRWQLEVSVELRCEVEA